MDFSTAYIILLVVVGGIVGLLWLIGWWEGEMKRYKRRKNGN